MGIRVGILMSQDVPSNPLDSPMHIAFKSIRGLKPGISAWHFLHVRQPFHYWRERGAIGQTSMLAAVPTGCVLVATGTR